MTVNAPPTVVAPPTFRSSPTSSALFISTSPLRYALPVTVNAAPTVAAAPTFKSLDIVAPIETVKSFEERA